MKRPSKKQILVWYDSVRVKRLLTGHNTARAHKPKSKRSWRNN